jgi:hypothetical protein
MFIDLPMWLNSDSGGFMNSRFVVATICATLIPLSSIFAQDKVTRAMTTLNVVFPRPVEEQLALSAAPEHLRAAATVYVFSKQGYKQTRQGNNGFTCLLNRDGFFYGGTQFKPTCWDAQGATTFVPVMLKVGELLAQGQSLQNIKTAIDLGFKNKTFKAPVSGGIAYMLAGDIDLDAVTGGVSKQVYPGHYMFYANGVTNAQLGVTREAMNKDPTLPFVFADGAGGNYGLSYIIAMPGMAHQHHAKSN